MLRHGVLLLTLLLFVPASGVEFTPAQSTLQQGLHNACVSGSLEAVQAQLKAGADPNKPDYPDGTLPLHEAIRGGFPNITRLLVKSGARLNETTPTALEVAILGRSELFPPLPEPAGQKVTQTIQMLELLLELGADPNANNGAALAAASGKNLKLLDHLVLAGGRPNHECLRQAVIHAKLDIIDALVKAGLDARKTNANGGTLLHSAIGSSTTPELIARLIALGIPVDARDDEGETAIFEALRMESPQCIPWLQKHGADIEATDKQGRTPLMVEAGQRGWYESSQLQILLECGARLDTKDPQGLTALDHAAAASAWENAAALLQVKAVPQDAKSMLSMLAHDAMTGVTELPNVLPVATQLLPRIHDLGALRVDGLPLVSWAVFAGSEPLAKLLVEADASLDATDEAGQTPLIHAARIGAVSMTKWLQNAGADSEHRDRSGLTAAAWAEKVVKMPSNHASGDLDDSRLHRPKSPPNDIFAAVAEDRLKELPQLLRDSPTAIHSSRGGLQPIHLAAALGHDEVLNLLLANGASLSDAASDSSTPLMIAAQFDQQGLIKKLAPSLSAEELRCTMEQLRSLWREWAHAGALNAMLTLGWKAGNQSDALLAVQHAVQEGNLPLLQRLLALKAPLKPTAERPGNVHDRAESHANLLELTLRHSDTRMLTFLLQNVPLKHPDWQQDLMSTLQAASRTGNLPAVRLLLETTPLDPNARLRPSPKPDAFSHDDVRVRITALCQALCYQQNEIVHYLLAHGARVEGTDYLSNAPLAAAVSGGDISLVELMLKHHVVVNETNDRGETALHIAAGAGHVEIARLLIRHGADPDIEDKEGRTPAEIAKVYGRPAW